MKILIYTLIILYGISNLLAGYASSKSNKTSKTSALLMMLGGALLLSSTFINFYKHLYSLLIALSALAMIHVSAVLNGLKMYKKLHITHHIIRGIISILICLSLIFI